MTIRRFAFVFVLACVALATVGLAAQKDKSPEGDWTGKLRLGVVAIGGETTGIVLETAAGKFELQPATKSVGDELKKLDGQEVSVHGTLAKRPGVEVKERRIITVTKVTKATDLL